jgi:hypothetical protein
MVDYIGRLWTQVLIMDTFSDKIWYIRSLWMRLSCYFANLLQHARSLPIIACCFKNLAYVTDGR